MRGLAKSTVVLAQYAYKLLEELNPMTLRQLHYAIFSKSEIDYQNDPASYKKLSRVTTMSRRLHRADELGDLSDVEAQRAILLGAIIPHGWIVDEIRQPHTVSVWEDAAEYVETVKQAYRRDSWQTQENYCEVWSEKATVLGSIRPVCNELGITVRVCRGFGSTGMEGQVGGVFEDIHKDITVFFLGDHDSSGIAIQQDIHDRAMRASGKEFEMERLAIHAEDIERFNLPPQEIKDTDTRSGAFRARFGTNAKTVELDALPVNELRERVRDSVTALIDLDLWEQQKSTEKAEFDCIQEFAAKIKNLPQLGQQ